MENAITKAEVEQLIAAMIETRLKEALAEFARTHEESKRKEDSLREIILARFDAADERFEALQREMNARFDVSDKRFETMDKRFEALQREMNARFDASDKRFEALLREMNARFEAVDTRFEAMDKRFEEMGKRFTLVQWMIGIFVGLPAVVLSVISMIKALV